MAESFSAALKRYIASGYKPPEAMRAVWQDVKVGRVARPDRRGRRYRHGTAGLPGRPLYNPAGVELIQFRADGHAITLGRFATFRRAAAHARRQQRLYPEDEFEIKGARGRRRYIAPAPTATGAGRLAGLVGPMRPAHRNHPCPPEVAGALDLAARYLEHPDVQAIPFALHASAAAERARRAVQRARENPVTLTARAAGKLARADPAVRRLPRVGWCVRLSDGRELCHDARGYYLVGPGRPARRTTYGSKRSTHAEYLEADVGRNPSRKMAEYQARLDRQVAATRQRRAIARGAPARELLYYAYARRPDGVIAQLLVRRAGGAQVSQTWTGVTYRNVREAEADVVRRNAQMYAHRRPSTVQARRTAMKLTARGINPARPSYQAYCLTCLGGGKALGRPTASKRAAEREATSHMSAYGHPVTITRPTRTNPRGSQLGRGRRNPMIIDPVAKLKTLRRIVGEHQAMRIGAEGQVDATTAHAILTVYDALSPANQQKYLAMPVRRMADVAWKLLSKKNPADPSRFLPAGHPVYQTRQRVPQWTVPVSPAHVPRLLRRRLGHFTKAQHEQHALEHQYRSEVAEDRWQQLVIAATRQYGSHGPLISGVVREHFPENVKRELRRLARAISEERDVAWAHWKAAGRRTGLASRNPRRWPRRALTVPEQHQLRIARASLRMPTPMLGVMGGPAPRQAARIVRRLGRGRRNQPLTVGAPEIQAFLVAWHEAGRAAFERAYRNLDYDSPYYQHVAKDRRKYIALDQGSGGKFLVDKATGEVFTIKGYGVPNRRIGTLAELTADYAAGRRDPYGARVNPRRRRTAGAWGSMGLVPRRRSRRPFRNPAAGFETFDLADRGGWERAIRTAGGLRVSKAERGELAEVPGYLKGYRRGVAPDELAQMIAEERGLPARQVERAMLAAFHGPRRRARTLEAVDYERLEREAIQLEGAGIARGGESRPRVRVGLDAFTLRPRSPFKGSIHHVNPLRRNPELTGEQHAILNMWARAGVTPWLRRVKSGWITDAPAAIGNFPTVFKTKREATERLDNLVRIRTRQWRGLADNPPRPRGAVIYDRLLELRARKGRRSHYPRELFKHGFKPGAQVIGLPSGDVLLHGARGQRLWQHVEV